MTELRQSRWVKVHKHGDANFDSKNNVIDITVGNDRYQAEVTYDTRLVQSFAKAAHWLFHSLEVANAIQAERMGAEDVQAKAATANKSDDTFTASGEDWFCSIENMGDGTFKAQLNWTYNNTEEATADEAPAEPAPTRKKRSRKKKAEVSE